ncbi:hypothetical protein [Litoribacillus peritrichatus]|uniref:MucBP domain-containing protein n=1 Tax=Litoribacillus peritrichatus TaxID=718191 RepID=A0ABP7MYM8_9GAMM
MLSMNSRIKYGLWIILLVLTAVSSANEDVKQDLLYAIQFDGEDVGYNRMLWSVSDQETRVYEVSDIKLTSFWGDTQIQSSKIEKYDADDQIIQGEYLTLFNEYLLASYLVATQDNLLKHTFQWFELNDPLLKRIQRSWLQPVERAVVNDVAFSPVRHVLKTLKPKERLVSFIDPSEFDVTSTSLSLNLPQLLERKEAQRLRTLNPETEDETLLHDLAVERVKNLPLEITTTHQQTETFKINYADGKATHVQYDLSQQPPVLVKVLDESDDGLMVLTLRAW